MSARTVAVVASCLIGFLAACGGSGARTDEGGTSAPAPGSSSQTAPRPAPVKPSSKAPDEAQATATATKPAVLPSDDRRCDVLEEPLRGFPGHDLSIKTRGKRLAETQEMQSLLNGADGSSCIREDGDFGDATRRAVMAFQKKNGLTVDGLVGAETWSRMQLFVSH